MNGKTPDSTQQNAPPSAAVAIDEHITKSAQIDSASGPNGGLKALKDAAPIESAATKSILENSETAQEFLTLEFQRYKARLDFWKFVLGSVVAGIAIALIPPLFQWGTAHLEKTKGETYLRNEVVRQFVINALDKDLENRIRLAHYFSNVADQPFREGWAKYHKELVDHRSVLRTEINDLEMKRALKLKVAIEPTAPEINELDQKLKWLRGELGGDLPATPSKPN